MRGHIGAVCTAVCLGILSAHAQGQIVTESQVFDSLASASSAGWSNLGNAANGNAFGFSATNLTGGASPSGEAGGVIARTPNLAYFADLTLGGVPTLNHQLLASGELNAVSHSNFFDNAIRIGFFNAADTTGFVRFAGFQVAENLAQSGTFRAFPTVHFIDGSRAESSMPLLLTANARYTWTTGFDPSNSRMSLEVFNSGGSSIGTSTVDLDGHQVGLGASFNAFGLVTGGWGQASATNVATVYVDNLTYAFTPVPEPTSFGLLGIATLIFGKRFMLRGREDAAARV